MQDPFPLPSLESGSPRCMAQVRMLVILNACSQGKKHRKRKASKPGKAIKEVTRRRYQGVDKEFQEHGRAPPPPPDQPQPVQVTEKQQYISEPSPNPSPSLQLKQAHPPPPVEPSYAQENRPGMAPPPPPPPSVATAQYSAPMAPPPPPPPAGMMGGAPPPPPPPDMGPPPQVQHKYWYG